MALFGQNHHFLISVNAWTGKLRLKMAQNAQNPKMAIYRKDSKLFS
jgi:hypothetical protein